ncbi:MAG: HAD family hydrolase, partial [Bacteroides sp.]|nr:HAD family hydrolase [Bacteroides sp.]
MKNIKVIGFDADDTLWINEPYFREAEQKFARLLSEYAAREEIFHALYETEIRNISLYGYGIKGFTLSMIETALH